MGKRPSKKDYAPSEAEKANAQVASSEYEMFKTKYAPLLQKRGNESLTGGIKKALRGRANADVNQTIGKPSMQAIEAPNSVGAMTDALQGQLSTADAKALDIQNKTGANVLAKARQQAGTAQEGMAEASRLATSAALTRAAAKEQVAQAKFNAAAQIGGAFVSQGFDNLSKGQDFFTPGKPLLDPKTGLPQNDPKTGAPQYAKPDNLIDRLSIGFTNWGKG